MQRALPILALVLAAAALSGCGIRGGLKTPPPLWGDGTTGQVPTETTTAESQDTADDPIDQSPIGTDPLREPEDEDFGYGVDVTRAP
ncbi:MAG: hypothetical protein AAF311_10390 [Pseudomonadota bacterium]